MSTFINSCPDDAKFWGLGGCALAMILTAFGASFGTAKVGSSIAMMGTFKPDLVMRSLVPVVMAGIVCVYGLIVSVVIAQRLNPTSLYPSINGYLHFCSGCTVGLAGLAAGYAIGVSGNACVKAFSLNSKMFIGMVLILIFAEVLGLYGMIVALVIETKLKSEC
ncbi:v-type proton ATPase 16 kDa proteolipid subunit 2 [Coelomomyces lativittatus]|nr:v-type proton ATPase 16 kDa proteolipid subunit 2 [Coelomomyces lativittatus]KAJ1506750.1 v-type proton ATPase 16 kDa proteolipid subunit 2 [Coelomomyces lativittatus]KAJ1511710.1 v-type proton ATPase 16 kDa proteolipid subunit 2 [Coelomomyces lativittatus]